MDVSRAGSIVPREDGQELGDATLIGLGKTAEEGLVVGGTIRANGDTCTKAISPYPKTRSNFPTFVGLYSVGVDSRVTAVRASGITML